MTCTFWFGGSLRKSGDIFVLSACAFSVRAAIKSNSKSFFIFPHSSALEAR
jgi:hypothetical protein